MIQHNAYRNMIIKTKHGRRQTSWLFTRRIEELNKGEPANQSTFGYSGTRDLRITDLNMQHLEYESDALTTRTHWLLTS